MNLVEVKCPNCGSTMRIEPDSSNVRCPYCRTEMYMDDEVSKFDRKLYSVTSAVNRLTKSRHDSKLEKEKIKLEKIQIAYEESRKNLKFLAIVFGVMLVISFMMYAVENIGNINKIAMPFASSQYKNENYQVVIQRLEDAGFTNVDTMKAEDLVFGFLTKEGEVDVVTVNGREEFEEGEKFDKTVRITVWYHAFPKKAEKSEE